MAGVRVTHSIGDLARDMAAIPQKVVTDGSKVVRHNVRLGTKITQRNARAASGPHGANYYKRISGEMTGVLEGEFGPTGNVVENAVGAGWRGGPQNTDLPRAADVVGPKFAQDVSDMVGQWFW